MYACYNFISEMYKVGVFVIKYCESHKMAADMFTKPLGKIKFNDMRDKIISIAAA